MENKNTDKQLQEIQQEIEEVHSDVEVIDKGQTMNLIDMNKLSSIIK